MKKNKRTPVRARGVQSSSSPKAFGSRILSLVKDVQISEDNVDNESLPSLEAKDEKAKERAEAVESEVCEGIIALGALKFHLSVHPFFKNKMLLFLKLV